MWALPIDRREIDRLGTTTHRTRNIGQRHVENQCRGLSVDVAAGTECFDECGITRQVCEQPQLDLRVISGEKTPAFTWNKPTPDIATELPTNGDVLKIRITGGQSPR